MKKIDEIKVICDSYGNVCLTDSEDKSFALSNSVTDILLFKILQKLDDIYMDNCG